MSSQYPPDTSPSPTSNPVQEAFNNYWSQRSEEYDAYQQREERREVDRRAWRRIWQKALPAKQRLEVLDVGTGSGYLARILAGLGHQVVGIDLAEGMLAKARQHARKEPELSLEFQVGDAVAPEFDPGSFDLIVNRYVMWTLRQPEVALANWFELLRPGGALAMVDAPWFTRGLWHDAPGDFREAYGEEARAQLPLAEEPNMDALVELVQAAGFVDLQVTPLPELLELDRQYGVAPNHHPELQFLVQARRP